MTLQSIARPQTPQVKVLKKTSIQNDSGRFNNRKQKSKHQTSQEKSLSGSYKACNSAVVWELLLPRMSVTVAGAEKKWAADKCSSKCNTRKKTTGYFASGAAESSMKLPVTGTSPFANKNSNNNRLRVEGSNLHRLSAQPRLALESEANSLKFNHNSNS